MLLAVSLITVYRKTALPAPAATAYRPRLTGFSRHPVDIHMDIWG